MSISTGRRRPRWRNCSSMPATNGRPTPRCAPAWRPSAAHSTRTIPAIHAGKETDAQYAALADRIQSQVNTIVANCHLPEEADVNLHYVIADLSQGAVLMRGQDPVRTRHDGAALVHGALIAYGTYFDDPDWAAEPAMKH